MKKIFLLFFVFTFFLSACIKVNQPKRNKPKDYSKKLIEVNRYLVEKDQQTIRDFITQHGWNMKQDSTGLWFEILKQGYGRYPKDGDKVVIDYKVQLLDGTLCYCSDSLGSMEFTINHSNVIRGVNDAVQKLQINGSGRFIIPPYLGYGLLGDQKCIPPRSIIIYYIILRDIK